MGTNNIEYCGRLCHSAAAAALIPAMGSGAMQTSQDEIEMSDCIFLAGVNIMETFPMIMRRILRAKSRGAKVIYTDPRYTTTAKNLANIHLPLKSGTDATLISAMMRIIIDEGLENKEFISSKTVGFDELRDSLSKVDLDEAAKVTGVPIEKIRDAAITYANAKRGCILYDQGVSQHYVGTDNVKLHADLALLCGHAGKQGSGINPLRGQINGEGGGDMGCLSVFYPGFKRASEETAKFFEQAWGVENLPAKAGLTYVDLMNNCSYLYIVGADPMMVLPDTNKLKETLQKAEFIVVQDIFPTEISKLADVVLPASTWVEREATHTWIDRRVQKINKIVDSPGEARDDWQIICKLADIMGYGDKFNFNTPEEIFNEVRSCVPQYKGITYERLGNALGGIHWPCPSEEHPGTPTLFLEKFGTPDGKGHFQTAECKPPAETPDDEYPYFLSTGRSMFHYHSGSMTRRTPRLSDEVGQGYVEINTDDAAKLGIKDKDTVTVATRRGSIEIKTKVTERVPSGLLFIPFHFPNTCANELTIPILDPKAKCAETKVCAARIEVK